MRILIFLFLLSGYAFNDLQAQEISAPAGGDILGAGGSVAFTVGQVVYTSHETANGSVTQGEQQSYLITEEPTAVSHEKLKLTCEVYPNPTSGFLKLKLHSYTVSEHSSAQYKLFDMNGNLVSTKQITSHEELIDMRKQVAGTYFLRVSFTGSGNNSVMESTCKIIKH